jgi:hypothetical protein
VSLRYVSQDHYTHSFDEAFKGYSVLFFDPRVELSNETIGDRLRELGDELREANLLIVRGSSETFFEEVEEDLFLPDLQVPVLALSPAWKEEDPAPRLRTPTWSEPSPLELDEAELRNLELLAMLEESGAIFEDPDSHYELPSHRHAKAFVRLADALCDVIDTVRIADWLIPSLTRDAALLADNGSLHALLSTAVLEAQERFGWPRLPIMTLRRYPNADRVAERLKAFERQGWRHVVGVISVNSSGELARLLNAQDEVSETVVVCETSTDGPRRALCHYPVEAWDFVEGSKCKACRDMHLLVVDTQSYEVRTDLHAEPQVPKISIAEEQKEFWEAADRTAAVQLHIEREIPKRSGQEMSETRHMSVYVDIARLLDDPEFRAHTLERLQAGPEPELVIVPEHASTGALEKLVSEAFDLGADSVLRYCGDPFAGAEHEAIGEASEVLVLDDALITGSTLFRISNELYRITQETERPIPSRAFVVLSRPARKSAEGGVKNHFTRPAPDGYSAPEVRFDAAAAILLPSDRECSFCGERDALKRRRVKVSQTEAITARIDALANSQEGLQEPLLIGGTEGTGKTIGSFFGQLKPRTALAAAASVAQRRRREFETHRRANTIEVLKTAVVIDGYYDPALTAGLLRTFDRRDLRNPEVDDEFESSLHERGKELAEGTLVEIAWAAALGKLPLEGIRNLLEELQTIEARDLLLELLALD